MSQLLHFEVDYIYSSLINKKEYKIDIPGLRTNGNDGKAHYKELINSKIFG